ncbi:serine hydrolase domain-containing protein [Microbacterium sp. NPDC056569]|uniref:serine hydrolase domain-containing protein n=1 Tax=Microbacterium sp. NPDC056569 TaxID=3345867 RepID=UPI00366AF2B3
MLAPRRASVRIIETFATAVFLLAGAAACTAAPSPAPVPSPEVAIANHLHAVLDAVTGSEEVRAVLVHQDAEPVYEEYMSSTPDDTWNVYSVTKSVTSTLVGIAIDRGLISGVDATLGDLLPEYAAVLTAETSDIPLQAVLTHTANFAPDGDVRDLEGSADWIATILQDRADRGPGDGSFVYSTYGSHVLAAVVAEATGMSPFAFAREVLFAPLGIEVDEPWEERLLPGTDPDAYNRAYENAEVAWIADPQALNMGGAWLRLRPGDLARFAQLFLDEGERMGDEIVSSTWVALATSPMVATPVLGALSYGFQWWVDEERDEFAGVGFGGTVVLVDRRKDAMVVIACDVARDAPPTELGLTADSALALAQALIDDLPDSDG